MHLVVDARSIHPHMGGIGRAALELIRAIALDPRGHRISAIVGTGHVGELYIKNASIIPVEAAMIDERFEQVHLPPLLSELKCDLYLNTTFSIPAVRTTRFQCSIIHDVVFEDRPELVEPSLGTYLSKWSRFAAHHADHVLTVSEHARTRIAEVYGISPEKILVVPNGIPRHAYAPPDPYDVSRARSKFGLRKPYIFYLGSIEPKKGISELLRAFRHLTDHGFEGELVLAGGMSGPAFNFESVVRELKLVESVRRLGFISEEDKKPLLASASLFVYPSLYEGFGIPPLEAMALGVPCIVSDQTSLPEVVGGAAFVTNVREPSVFGQALRKGLEDNSFRKAVRSSGPARAREFTWERSALRFLNLVDRLEAA